MKKNLKKPDKPNPFRWLALTGYSAQLGITIYGSVRLGQWLDHNYQTDRTWTLVCVLLGLFVSVIILLEQLKTINHSFVRSNLVEIWIRRHVGIQFVKIHNFEPFGIHFRQCRKISKLWSEAAPAADSFFIFEFNSITVFDGS